MEYYSGVVTLDMLWFLKDLVYVYLMHLMHACLCRTIFRVIKCHEKNDGRYLKKKLMIAEVNGVNPSLPQRVNWGKLISNKLWDEYINKESEYETIGLELI